ncbi:hypothetical protein CCZ01_03975 [Helicobacter monodelphidis]|uniref:uroporphyrinogen-III synthase n=1 Tax=Helicobacter sp. 15-1451 TaxID=2004995 RepID=UPI000DCF01D0|nr:uroporphyrinogen-III synthase [Helicobacter sp. 15-1451]RAX58238.1 hypothetical protein CCZ01_03975 [Helicobacter sp. 15-1451]
MIYVVGNQSLEGVVNLPIIQREFLTPSTLVWKNALGLKESEEIPADRLKNTSLIFTSKQSVEALRRLQIPIHNAFSYVIGSKTKAAVLSYCGQVTYSSQSGYGHRFVEEIRHRLNKEFPIIYFRPQKSFTPIANLLPELNICEIILYKTLKVPPKEKILLDEKAIILFGSPSCYDAFKCFFSWKSSYRGIAIGKSTFDYLDKEVQQNSKIAPQTSFESMREVAIQWENS